MAIQEAVMQVTLISSYRNQVANNVLHYRFDWENTQIPTPQALNDFLETFSAFVVPDFKECLSQEARYEGCRVVFFNPLNPLQDRVATTTDLSGPGTVDTAGSMPSQTCGLISKLTVFPGRQGRGRFYMPFPPDAALNSADDLIQAAYRTVLVSLSVQLQNSFDVDPFDGQLRTFTPGLYKRGPGSIFRAWTSSRVGLGFATQRRRGFFGRPNTVPPL